MKYDVVIIGAGIVGLATTLKLLENRPGLKLLIIEKENGAAKHQTGNNSGVIHSGIYYKPGSLKAENCRHGYDLLLKFCDENNINYKICGKLIVAVSEEEIPRLNNLYERGIQNGLDGLTKIDGAELKDYEPHVNGVAGLHVPQTGIINFKLVADKMLEVIRGKGGDIEFNRKVRELNIFENDCEVVTEDKSYNSKMVVSCAGLFSDKIAKMTNPDLPLKIIPFRGEYYKIKKEKRYLVNNLIYPVPDPAFPFLGVHFTRMIDDEVEAGPNAVFAFKREGYKKFDFNLGDTLGALSWTGFQKVMKKYWRIGLGEYYRSFSKNAFVKALRELIPEITEEDLVKGGAGVRAQACDRDGGMLDDFYIDESKRVIHVCNAPSPAATSSLSIGEYIANKINSRLE
jgi:L-2-hydroxyglutarate oxidase